SIKKGSTFHSRKWMCMFTSRNYLQIKKWRASGGAIFLCQKIPVQAPNPTVRHLLFSVNLFSAEF
ncbi:MAG: hypothetical protein ACOCWK_10115, partial [Tangfeifania sp.]